MPDPKLTSRAIGWLALASVVMIVLLNGKPSFTNASMPPRGIHDNVVALQVARNVKEVDAILGDAPSPDRVAMRMKQWLDFPFIACYAALYIALAILFFPHAKLVSVVAAASGVSAAAFDVLENFAILRVVDTPLRGTTQGMVDAIRSAGLTKWLLVFFATALFAVLFLKAKGQGSPAGGRRLRTAMRTAIGVVDLIAAGLGFYGLYENSFLVWASMGIGLGLVLMVAGFFRVTITFRRET